jgi:sulfate permease, SulP family
MLIPQGMAYALLAGLPPVAGIYSSILPLVAYALLGSSRQISIGPVALLSIMTAGSVGVIAAPGTEDYFSLCTALALLVGAFKALLWATRAGTLSRLLTHPVVSGFVSAASLLIALSQMKHILGIQMAPSSHFPALASSLLQGVEGTHPPTVAIGAGACIFLVAMKRRAPGFPRALAAVLLCAVAVYLLGEEGSSVRLVGEVPSGLPTLSLPILDTEDFVAIAPAAVLIALVGYAESMALAKTFSAKHGYGVDANRELLGLGLANIASALSGGFAVSAGFSRSAVNDQAGARTPAAGLFTALSIALSLLFLSPLFTTIPNAALGAIVFTASLGLLDWKGFAGLLRTSRADASAFAATFLSVLSLGIEWGLCIGLLAGQLARYASNRVSS